MFPFQFLIDQTHINISELHPAVLGVICVSIAGSIIGIAAMLASIVSSVCNVSFKIEVNTDQETM